MRVAEFTPRLKKYETIVAALQARIADGTYPPGSMLPSETQIMAEFDVARPTAARVFELLRLQGWIEAHQGKGRFVTGVPAPARGIPDRAAALLALEVDGRVRVLDVARRAAPNRAMAALELESATPVVVRRWLTTVAEVGPVELATAYVPVELAVGTDVGSIDPLPDGLLRHLAARKQIGFTHATERISARMATAEESTLLELARRECVLTSLLAAHDRTGRPVVALDLVHVPTRIELEDSFPITL